MKKFRADVAQLVEHSLGKGEVTSSILVIGSSFKGCSFVAETEVDLGPHGVRGARISRLANTGR
jgi:hypothetical protein